MGASCGLPGFVSTPLSLGAALARDSNGWLVALLPSEWALKTFSDKNEDWLISEQPFPPPVLAK